ncbi:MAG: tetratricopeptide repeat protein [Hyphomicrobiaceae bacterium]
MRYLNSHAAQWLAGLLACAALICTLALPGAATAQSARYEVPSAPLAEVETLTARAMRLYRSGDTHAAVRAFEAASATAEKHFGGKDPKFVQSLNNLALIYDLSGALDRAEMVYLRAIAIVEGQRAAALAQLANLRNNLAAVVLQQCRVGDARALYKQAVDLSEKSLGGQHFDTRMMRKNVSQLDRYLGATAAVHDTDGDTDGVGKMLQRCVG